jgi:hypothetical protein
MAGVGTAPATIAITSKDPRILVFWSQPQRASATRNQEQREYYVGWSTVKVIVGNKFVPSLADRYLARSGYESQQYDRPENSNCPNNLCASTRRSWSVRSFR